MIYNVNLYMFEIVDDDMIFGQYLEISIKTIDFNF